MNFILDFRRCCCHHSVLNISDSPELEQSSEPKLGPLYGPKNSCNRSKHCPWRSRKTSVTLISSLSVPSPRGHQWRIQDFSDGEEGTNLRRGGGGCVNLLFGKIVTENCIKMKEFWTQGVPSVLLGSATGHQSTMARIELSLN